MLLSGCTNLTSLQLAHRQWVSSALKHSDDNKQQSYWSNSIAVGSEAYVKSIQAQLGSRAYGRKTTLKGDHYALKENSTTYP